MKIPLIILGVILLGLISHSMNKLGSGCVSKPIKDGLAVIIMLAFMVITLGVSQSLCYMNIQQHFYTKVALVLGLILIITSAVMLADLRNEQVQFTCNKEEVQKGIIGVLVIGCILFLVSIVKIKN